MNEYWERAGVVLLMELAGYVGALFTTGGLAWYAGLAKPFLTPPAWLFGPVWFLLYALMGLALFPLWDNDEAESAQNWFGGQLLLNVFWPIIFFGMRMPDLALLVIVALWLATAVTIIKFKEINRTAGLLLIPYFIWIAFAIYLNYGILVLN